MEKFNAFKAKKKLPPSKSFIDEEYPIKITIQTSLECAYRIHGDKLTSVFEENLRTTTELEDFYRGLRIKGVQKTGELGNGAVIYTVRNLDGLKALIERAKKHHFNIKNETQAIAQADSIIKDPEKVCEEQDTWLNYITSQNFTDSLKPFIKRRKGDRNDGFELN